MESSYSNPYNCPILRSEISGTTSYSGKVLVEKHADKQRQRVAHQELVGGPIRGDRHRLVCHGDEATRGKRVPNLSATAGGVSVREVSAGSGVGEVGVEVVTFDGVGNLARVDRAVGRQRRQRRHDDVGRVGFEEAAQCFARV